MLGKHTLNNFKNEIRSMDRKQQIETLNDLRSTLLEARSKAQKGQYSQNVRLIRHQIAVLKTVMNEKGFHYNPR